MNRLNDAVNRFTGGVHLNPLGVLEIALRQFVHLFGHRRRKQHGLALCRQNAGNTTQRVNESQIQHLIGLVENQKTGVGQAQSAPVQQIDQPARGCNQKIRASLQALNLHVD